MVGGGVSHKGDIDPREGAVVTGAVGVRVSPGEIRSDGRFRV